VTATAAGTTTATDAWRDRVFCMIGPDSLRRGLTSELLGRFRAVGVRPSGWLLRRIGKHQVDVMSALQGVAPNAVYRFRALDALFDLGPALMVVLRDREARDTGTLYRLLADLKGDADPRHSVAGTLRHDFGGLNVVLSLLHVSDDPEQSAREALVLTGIADPSGFHDPSGLDHLVAAWEAATPPETRGLVEVLGATRTSVLAKLWHLLTPADQMRMAELAAKGCLADPVLPDDILGRLGAAGADPVLTGFLGAPFTGDGPHPDLPALRHLLSGDAMTLDPWAYAVLATSTYFRARGRDCDG
jgi:nucleoside diphosphate kinase